MYGNPLLKAMIVRTATIIAKNRAKSIPNIPPRRSVQPIPGRRLVWTRRDYQLLFPVLQFFAIQAVLVTGLVSVLAQTLLLRELVMVFYGNELTIAFMISAWLLWGAIGSIAGARLLKRYPATMAQYAGCQVLVALMLPVELLLIRGLKLAAGIPVGELTDPFTILALSCVILAPVGLVNGCQFTLGARMLSKFKSDADGGAGRVYGLDAIGDMVGAAAFGYVCVYYLSPLLTILTASFLSTMSATALLAGMKRRITAALGGVSGLLLAAGAVLLPLDEYDLETRGWNWRDLAVVATSTSIYGDVSIVKYGSMYSIYENGLLSFSTPLKLEAEELVHLTLVQTPKPEKILILGGALPGVLHEIMKYPVQEVRYVEPDPALVGLVRPYLEPKDRSALEDPRLRITTGDGRRFVKNWRGAKFDAVMVNAGDPVTLFLNRFYTIDFFEELAAVMRPQGVVRLAVSSKEAYLSGATRNYNGSIYHTLKKAFPYVKAIPGDQLILLASQDGSHLTLDPELISRRLDGLAVPTEFMRKDYLQGILLPHQISYIRDVLETSQPARFNRDLRPITFSYGLAYWSTYFKPWVRKALGVMGRVRFYWIAALLAIILMLAQVRRNRRENTLAIVAGVMGFQGMAAVIMAVLAYEMLFGYVYHRVGLLTAGFMLGLFLGTFVARRTSNVRPGKKLLATLCGSLVYWLLFYWGLSKSKNIFSQGFVGELFPVLTLVPGVMVGAAFSATNQLLSREGDRLPKVYAADLVGGCVGGMVTSLILIPNHGLKSTCVILGALITICSLFTLVARYNSHHNSS